MLCMCVWQNGLNYNTKASSCSCQTWWVLFFFSAMIFETSDDPAARNSVSCLIDMLLGLLPYICGPRFIPEHYNRALEDLPLTFCDAMQTKRLKEQSRHLAQRFLQESSGSKGRTEEERMTPVFAEAIRLGKRWNLRSHKV